MKILLAVDGSAYTKRMLDYIASHEELLGPSHEYTLCTAVAAIPPHAARFLDQEMLDGYYREQADEVLQPLSPSWTDRAGAFARPTSSGMPPMRSLNWRRRSSTT